MKIQITHCDVNPLEAEAYNEAPHSQKRNKYTKITLEMNINDNKNNGCQHIISWDHTE